MPTWVRIKAATGECMRWHLKRNNYTICGHPITSVKAEEFHISDPGYVPKQACRRCLGWKDTRAGESARK